MVTPRRMGSFFSNRIKKPPFLGMRDPGALLIPGPGPRGFNIQCLRCRLYESPKASMEGLARKVSSRPFQGQNCFRGRPRDEQGARAVAVPAHVLEWSPGRLPYRLGTQS